MVTTKTLEKAIVATAIKGQHREAGELSAGELVERLGLPQATVSTHLGCLRWCGFVATRREGRSVIYRVADSRVSDLVALADSLLADNAEHVAGCETIDATQDRG